LLWSALCWVAAAQSSPISSNGVAESTERPTQPYPRMSEADLVLSDPRLELRPDLGVLELGTDRRAGGIPVRRGSGAPGDTDGMAGPDSGTWLGGLAVRDALRGYVNAPRGTAGPESGADRRRGPQGEPLGLAGVDLGPAANEWIQETVQNILSSALRLDINERGQTSFSVLGLGEFSVHLSADRSEVALTSGDNVLVTAKRAPEAGGPGYGGTYGNGGWESGGTAITPGSSVAGESPLRQALELAMELASHPLSFLVYGVILAYLLLWSILSRRSQPHRARQEQYFQPSPSRTTGTPRPTSRRRHRSRPSTHRT